MQKRLNPTVDAIACEAAGKREVQPVIRSVLAEPISCGQPGLRLPHAHGTLDNEEPWLLSDVKSGLLDRIGPKSPAEQVGPTEAAAELGPNPASLIESLIDSCIEVNGT